MKTIQSLSVVVPNPACINDCAFCVSKMHAADYPNLLDENLPHYDFYIREFRKRLEFARDNGCNTLMITGNTEPQQNKHFLVLLGLFIQMMKDPFKIIEMQTTGVMLDDGYLRFLRNHVGVNTISLSISSFDEEQNKRYTGMKPILAEKFNLKELCKLIKTYGFTLRLSLNLTDAFNGIPATDLFEKCKEYGADQVTLRVLYSGNNDTPQDRWLKEHSAHDYVIEHYNRYVEDFGESLEVLEFGAIKYDLMGMSIVIDTDCMSKAPKDAYKYLVLRPNCHLYSRWDTPASLIF